MNARRSTGYLDNVHRGMNRRFAVSPEPEAINQCRNPTSSKRIAHTKAIQDGTPLTLNRIQTCLQPPISSSNDYKSPGRTWRAIVSSRAPCSLQGRPVGHGQVGDEARLVRQCIHNYAAEQSLRYHGCVGLELRPRGRFGQLRPQALALSLHRLGWIGVLRLGRHS